MMRKTRAKERPELLFAYGTLQHPEIQNILFGTACLMRNAVLRGWKLYVSLGGWLFIKPDPMGSVSGKLLELDEAALRAADLWEEVPVLYQREKVVVRLEDGDELEVWAYTRRNATGTPYSGSALSLLEREDVLAAAHRSVLN